MWFIFKVDLSFISSCCSATHVDLGWICWLPKSSVIAQICCFLFVLCSLLPTWGGIDTKPTRYYRSGWPPRFMLEQQHIPTTFVQCIKTSWFLSLVACVVYSLCSSFAICTDFQCSWVVFRFKNWKVFIPFFCLPFLLLMSTSVTPNTFLGPVQAPFSTVLLGIYYLGTTRVYLTCCRKGSCSIYWPYVLRCTKRQISVRCSQHPSFLYMPSYLSKSPNLQKSKWL